jgi:putative inorganic carbon (HCO3(-)) transporter
MTADLNELVDQSRIVRSLSRWLASLFAVLGESGLYRFFSWLGRRVGESFLLSYVFDRPFGPSPFSTSGVAALAAKYFPNAFEDRDRLTYWGLTFLVLFVPVELTVIHYTPYAVKYAGDAVILLLFVYLLSGAAKGAWAFRATPVDLPVLAFGAVGLASGIPLKVLFFGLRAYLEYYVVYLVVVAAPLSEEERRRLLWTFVVWAVFMALVGSGQKILGVVTPRQWVEAIESIRTRTYGTMGNPNTYAGYLVVALSLFISLLTTRQSPFYRALLAVGVALGAFALLFTYSREGLIAFAASLLVIGFVADRRILVLLLGLGALALIADPKIVQRFAFGFSTTYVSLSLNYGRLYYWLQGLVLWAHHPLLGVGPGRFGGSVAHIFGSPWYHLYGLGTMSTVDSEPVQVLGETGILGFLCYLWILVTLVRQGIRLARTDPDPWWRSLGVASSAATVGFAVQSVFASLFEVHQVVLGLWFLAGLVGWRSAAQLSARGRL